MTQSEWLTSTDLDGMLKFLLSQQVSVRGETLFGVACCRRIWALLAEGMLRRVVEVTEKLADGNTVLSELRVALTEEHEEQLGHPHPPSGPVRSAVMALSVSRLFIRAAGESGVRARCALVQRTPQLAAEVAAEREGEAPCHMLRDLFGSLPFRPPPPLAPSLLAWHAGLIPRLAQAAYEERTLSRGELDNARPGVLADALEDAGCTDASLLGHLRGDGDHWRGCWALDAVRGRS